MFRVEGSSFGRHAEYTLKNEATGEQANITSLGANTRRLELSPPGKRPIPIINGYDTAEALEEGTWARGIKMVPFPNRIEDGRYEFAGRTQQLPINFPQQHHAIHGLMSTQEMDMLGRAEDSGGASVTLGLDFDGKFEGYPFSLHLEVRHILSESGFSVETTAENTGDGPLPFGDGWHPYFKFGARSDVDAWKIRIPAMSRVEMNERLIPTGSTSPTQGTEYDFLKPGAIGQLTLDDVFTDLIPEGDELITTLASDEAGVEIEVWQKEMYRYLVIFTPPDQYRDCVAIEPMTCNTNAFNNGQGLLVLEPGEIFEGLYGVRVG